MARGLKFRNLEVEELYYLCSENKGADQLRGYREADRLFVFAYEKSWFSHNEAQFIFELFTFYGDYNKYSKCPKR